MFNAGSGRDFGKKLVDAGIVPPNARRVVIDIPADGRMVVYVECYGDARILELGTDDFKHAVVIRSTDVAPGSAPCRKCGIVKPMNEWCANCRQQDQP